MSAQSCDVTIRDEIFDRFKPQQVKSEIFELLRLLDKKRPRTILEIGTFNGGTISLFNTIKNVKILISVDVKLVHMYNKNEKIHLIRGDSGNRETLKKIKNISPMFDFIFIDGDHVKVERDFHLYSKLINKHGMIALHDINAGEFNCVGVVPDFWSRIKNNHDTLEINHNYHNGCGIGVIRF